MTRNETLTAIGGIRVGHWMDEALVTGCTVVLCPPGTIGGVDQRGGAPGTRETDLLRPMHLVNEVHGLLLAGGSAFGLSAADGVMRYLREQGVGFPTGSGVRVPIVPGAILYDLEIGKPEAPDSNAGYTAATEAMRDLVASGNVGAGTGCTVGKLAGMANATKGGLGSAAVNLQGGLRVAALFAVNAVGDVVGEDGTILAGMRDPQTGEFTGTLDTMKLMNEQQPTGNNTVIGVVATNARLPKEAVNKVAQMAHDGLARAVRPAHLMYDGDMIFALATGTVEADVNLVGALAAEVSAVAIRDGVLQATTLGGVRAGSA